MCECSFLDGSSFEPTIHFYRLVPVEDGGATGHSLKTTLEGDDLGFEQVISYASDGENLMQGQNNSVLTKIRDESPCLLVLKCYFHTFHLGAEHASKTLSKTADQLIHDVYSYFKMSPNRQKSFREFQQFVEVEALEILKHCQSRRWLVLRRS